MIITETKFKQCPHCGSTCLSIDKDGLYCLCGWHEYDNREFEEAVYETKIPNYPDRGCKLAKSCFACPFPNCKDGINGRPKLDTKRQKV
jgi:hypothetical protein